MSELGIATAAPDKIVLAVVSHLNEGQIDDALALFADEFSFKDHGIRGSHQKRQDQKLVREKPISDRNFKEFEE